MRLADYSGDGLAEEATQLLPVANTEPTIPQIADGRPFVRMARGSSRLGNCWMRMAASLEILSAAAIALVLNLLDIIAYGRIIFPVIPTSIGRAAHAVPNTMVMYTVTTVVAQLCFTAISSLDRGVLAGMMVEAIPFYHNYFWTIYYALTLHDAPVASLNSLYPTLFFLCIISTLSIAAMFFLLGYSNLSEILQYFPRQCIYGCMGAIGYFLGITGLRLIVSGISNSTAMEAIHKQLSLFDELIILFKSKICCSILLISFFMALLAVAGQRHPKLSQNPFIIPSMCLFLVLSFYAFLFSSGMTVEEARQLGWILVSPKSSRAHYASFWDLFSFYQYYLDFSNIQWSVIPKCLPTFLGLVMFALINVPINVPAFSAATKQRPNIRHELKLHGLSNFLGIVCGGLANYFIFSNSLLFFQSGARLSRNAGYLAALLTSFALFFIYHDIFDFLPKFVPVFLVFYLMLELLSEAFFKSYKYLTDKRELLTIVTIFVIAAVVGFSEALFVGLALNFLDILIKLATIQVFDRYLAQIPASGSIFVLEFHGFLFFGNIKQVIARFHELVHYVDGLPEGCQGISLVMDVRSLHGWDLTAQLELKSLTEQLLSSGFGLPEVSWYIVGLPITKVLFQKAGWIDIEATNQIQPLNAPSFTFYHASDLPLLLQRLNRTRQND